ncbi:hypothetical protein ACJJTC_016025 [Scirpophaga incertulas]
MTSANESPVLLPHHKQTPLCTTRLPYRQGRNLKAVKVYSIINESTHLLIFGVPSLNLRQETKSLFIKFGKLIQFTISKDHAADKFTETYHAVYERIQSARLAKRFLDTKNFYGSTLHICYAPELETLTETRNKLLQRQQDVTNRLKKLQEEKVMIKPEIQPDMICDLPNIDNATTKLDMGVINTIPYDSKQANKRISNGNNIVIEKKFKPCFVNDKNTSKIPNHIIHTKNSRKNIRDVKSRDETIEVIDCTSVEKETITNINDNLNYNNFGNETVRVLAQKPLNKIRFNINNKNFT